MPDPDLLLHHIFYATAARLPEQIAIDIPPNVPTRPHRTRLTYRELAERADSVADWLAVTINPTPDAIVAVLLPRHTPDLYAAQLGILKSGAAFTCLDPTFPPDHIRQVLAGTGAVVLVTDAEGQEFAAQLGVQCPVLCATPGRPNRPVSPPLPVGPHRLAYVIYTSGTSGRPKGVLIEHRGVVNLALANVSCFGLGPDDRVAQCSSPVYDSSIEETWLAFAVGATLVPLDDHTVRLGPDLVPWLRAERITVLCPPPTLLRATGCTDPATELPDLRLLYVGGEPLPPDLADRWSRGRRLENGYGPTECTVTVLRGPVRSEHPVTIGRPVPGHRAWVMDDELNEVPEGEPGELCVAGVGLARGYLNEPGLTAERFAHHPRFGRLYRTGDAARLTADGEFVHLGRIDDQVKLRGYRIELGAIDAVLAGCPGVRAAACRVQGDGASRLIAAHLVPTRADAPLSVGQVREFVGRALPPYMVPARYGFTDRLPTKVGGKLSREDLPDLAGVERFKPFVAPAGADETAVAAAFAKALGLNDEVSAEDDFFLDLGGDSLAAVTALLALRESGYASVAVRELYEGRTASRLAAALRRPRPVQPLPPPARATSPVNPFYCTVIQVIWLTAGLVGFAVVGCVLAVRLLPAAVEYLGIGQAVLLITAVVALSRLLWVVAAVGTVSLAKRALIGRYRAGRYPVWGGFYTRHWIVTRLASHIPWGLFEGTVFVSVILRLLGARVGRRVYLHAGVDLGGGGWDLLTVGDDVTVGQDARIAPGELDCGDLVFGAVSLGEGVTLGIRSAVSPGASVGPNGYLEALSWVPPGGHVPAGERWDGVPAAHMSKAPDRPATTSAYELSPLVIGGLVVAGRLLWPLVTVSGVLLAMTLAIPGDGQWLRRWLAKPEVTWWGAGVAALFVALSPPLGLVVRGLAVRMCGRVRPGVYSLWGWTAVRLRLKAEAVDAAGHWLTGSMYWPWWLRLAGMRVGRNCEVSTLINLAPDTVVLGDGCFLTDGIYLGCPTVHRGTVTVAETRLGAGTFVGNQAVVAAGHAWPDGLFVGVSTAPDPHRVRPDSAWFGHPPMELPRRAAASAERPPTRPSSYQVVRRLVWETLRFTLPLVSVAAWFGWYVAVSSAADGPLYPLLLVAVVATAGVLAAGVVTAVAIKWVVLGRVRPGQHSLWSGWCCRWEFNYIAWEHLAQDPASALEGTLLLNALLRATGMRIGRRVVLGGGSAALVDPDMIEVGESATVTADFQAHTFEDRVLKVGRVRVEAGASVGPHAVVLYDATVGEHAWVAPHSVVMKGDTLSVGGRYCGCPANLRNG